MVLMTELSCEPGWSEPAPPARVRRSAGLLLWRRRPGVEVLLAHPGGPYYRGKDAGAWTIPKGEPHLDEPLVTTAYREFQEELGLPVPDGRPVPLGDVRQRGGKLVTAWAIEGDLDVDAVVPGTFVMRWPPRYGTAQRFPEVDRVGWFDLPTAAGKILVSQRPFLDRLTVIAGAE